jgi:hypothetical protein
MITFVPAGLVLLANLRENMFGGFWQDKSDVGWTTRHALKVKKVEVVLSSVLLSIIFNFLIVLIFVLSR